MEISVTDFSAPIGASVFKFCVHLKVGKVYCVNANKDAKAHFDFFFSGAQWLSGRVLDSRPKGRGFEPHRHHCVVSLSKTHLS